MIIFLSLSQPKGTAMHHPLAQSAAILWFLPEQFFFFNNLCFALTWEGTSFKVFYMSLFQLLALFL